MGEEQIYKLDIKVSIEYYNSPTFRKRLIEKARKENKFAFMFVTFLHQDWYRDYRTLCFTSQEPKFVMMDVPENRIHEAFKFVEAENAHMDLVIDTIQVFGQGMVSVKLVPMQYYVPKHTYIRHVVNDMGEGEYVQRCLICGKKITDLRGASYIKEDGKSFGWKAGELFISKGTNPTFLTNQAPKGEMIINCK